ncbi:MAG: hypothetical protein WC551_07305 [Patescibacteria group bacterium]
MDTNVAKYFDACDMLRDAALDASICLENQKSRWLVRLGLVKARSEEYERLRLEAERLAGEVVASRAYVIRANLANLGVQDQVVTAVLMDCSEKEWGKVEMLLSDVCGLRGDGIASKLGISEENERFYVLVQRDGKRIGRFDIDLSLDGVDLRTAMGWAVATQIELVEFFDLDRAVSALLEVVRDNGTSREAFFGPYFGTRSRIPQLKDFSGAAIMLWKAATRELGKEHDGYDFLC